MSRIKRLIVVTASDMNSTGARLQTYSRARAGSRWVRRAEPVEAVVGAAGMAWGYPFVAHGAAGDPVKTEGDKRTPAGIFALGATFGTEKDGRPGYIRLKAGRQVCVDDPASVHYNVIVPRSVAGEGTSGEEMWREPLYARGILVDYPSSREAKAGSCIFVHIRAPSGAGTAGCVAASERTIEDLQEWVSAGRAAIAILPEAAREKFKGCLP